MAIGTATGYELDGRGVGVRVPVGARFVFISTWSRPILGPTQPPIQWVPGATSPGIKRPGREADQSPPTSAEVKNTSIYTSTPPYVFMAFSFSVLLRLLSIAVAAGYQQIQSRRHKIYHRYGQYWKSEGKK
jgi:hypothetical protein